MKIFICGLSVLLALFSSCARAPIKDAALAMRLTKERPAFTDDLDYQGLKAAIVADAEFLKKDSRSNTELIFGPIRISKEAYANSLIELLNSSSDLQSFCSALDLHFDLYEVYGGKDWAEVKATSYYAPLIQGSKTKTNEFSQPLYALPPDLLSIDIDAYAMQFPKWKEFRDQVLEAKSDRTLARGRYIKEKNTIVPYFSRSEIDIEKPVLDKKAVLAYVDPIKSFFLQIQGSGTVIFSDGTELNLGYAGQNGHPYVAIGSFLLDKIPKEKMSMQSIEAYLRTVSSDERQRIMNINPSYVFFQKNKGRPLTYLGTEAVDGRTIATDKNLFPKGALAFLQFEKPQFKTADSLEPIAWSPSARFVLDQDTGGAIRGPGRLDLYAGRGPTAEQFAGVLKNAGRLYYFVPKQEYLNQLSSK